MVSTRTDIFSKEYIEVLKTLQAEVPGFSGAKAKSIVEEELGKPIDELFQSFSPEPFAAASLGQVWIGTVRGVSGFWCLCICSHGSLRS